MVVNYFIIQYYTNSIQKYIENKHKIEKEKIEKDRDYYYSKLNRAEEENELLLEKLEQIKKISSI